MLEFEIKIEVPERSDQHKFSLNIISGRQCIIKRKSYNDHQRRNDLILLRGNPSGN